jgi:leader peptidase (prepilin peptidase)/N-methyltransferase
MTAVTTSFGAVLAAAFGVILGSFLNVVAYRLPRGESLSIPRSRCPECETPIKFYDNIPVLSWLLLRRRCRSCRSPISWRYALVELGTAILLALVVVAKGADSDAWLGLALVLLLVPITLIDLDHRIIPNKILLPAAVWGLAATIAFRPDNVDDVLIAGAAAFGALLLAALAYPAGMGMGDVKLAGVMGIYLGSGVAPAMLVAFLAGSIVGLAIIAREGRDARKKGIPFGPFLAFGGLVGIFAGPELVDVYVDHFL